MEFDKDNPAAVLRYFSEVSFEKVKQDYKNYLGNEFFFDKDKTKKLIWRDLLKIGSNDKFNVYCLSDDWLNEAPISDFMQWNNIPYDPVKYTR